MSLHVSKHIAVFRVTSRVQYYIRMVCYYHSKLYLIFVNDGRENPIREFVNISLMVDWSIHPRDKCEPLFVVGGMDMSWLPVGTFLM